MASETALPIPDLLAGLDPKATQQLRRHAVVFAFSAIFGPVRVCARRVTDSLQLADASLEVPLVKRRFRQAGLSATG